MRNHYQRWEVSYNLLLVLLYAGQPLGSLEKHLQVLRHFSWCHFSPGLCHLPSNVSQQGTGPETPGSKGSAVPTTMVHPPYRLPWERTWNMWSMGWSTGTVATARTCFRYSNFPSCWNVARRKIHRVAQDYRNTNKSLDLNITHQNDFLT